MVWGYHDLIEYLEYTLVSHVGLNLLRPKPISIKLEMRIESINFFSNHVAHNITNTDIIASNEDDTVVSQRYLYCKKNPSNF
jgi:hypothetical protein